MATHRFVGTNRVALCEPEQEQSQEQEQQQGFPMLCRYAFYAQARNSRLFTDDRSVPEEKTITICSRPILLRQNGPIQKMPPDPVAKR